MTIHANTAPMNWDLAIERNRNALMRILAALLAMLPEGNATTQITRRLHAAILFVLRPAESAVRRLIVVTARRLETSLPPVDKSRQTRALVDVPTAKTDLNDTPWKTIVTVNLGLARGGRKPKSSEAFRVGENEPRSSAFPLCDPLKRFGENSGPKTRRDACPNIWFPGAADRVIPVSNPEPHAEDLVNAAPVIRRLKRLEKALGDIPGEAKRLMTSRARRQRVIALRPGAPPGHRKRHRHEIDDILQECQWLAREALEPPEASLPLRETL